MVASNLYLFFTFQVNNQTMQQNYACYQSFSNIATKFNGGGV
jgi:hypothetical protein